jgi:glycosyltransferase involved in cell wall biosynthesis
VGNNNDEAMVSLVEQYLSSPAWREQVGHGCRAFAETHLAWPMVAKQHINIYQQFAV